VCRVKRATRAVAILQTLDTELRSQHQDIQNSISQAATSLIQEVRTGRLRSISLDELKKHEGGLRLQALKDSGIRTLADIQGWNENRISQVRGVGPKSASSIARLVSRLSSVSNALPIPSPTPPFALDRERILLQAIYRDCWFEIHLSPQRKGFDDTIRHFEERLSQVVATTTFSRWLWSLGARVGAAQPAAPAQFILPSNTQKTSKRVRWMKKGETTIVQGIPITKGLFYFRDEPSGGEQWAINPNLQAKRSDQPSEESPGYYYNYFGLTPEQRFRYLKWLSEGASSNEDPGFGLLYLGGLERRIIQALAGHETLSAPEEREDILSEISRLANLFQSTRGSVTHSARHLLEFIKTYGLSGSALPKLPELWERGYELPASLLYGLGYLIQAKDPIPLDWALRWAYLEPTFYLRTPATRCRTEYEAAFAYVYKERCGAGLVIPPNKTILKINYQAMSYSSGLTGIECKFTGIPDVRALTAPQQTLREIVEQSTAMVDSYSRFLGRNASKAGSLEACLTLPLVLWPENAKQRLQEIQITIAEKLQPVSYKQFLQQLGCEEELSSGRSAELVKSLSHISLGFEPDAASADMIGLTVSLAARM
jgi:hypothetical protein